MKAVLHSLILVFLALLPEELLKNVTVDTTVQEKAIAFPTDTQLCHRMRIKLLAGAKKRKIELSNLRKSWKKSMYDASSLCPCKADETLT